MSNGTSIFRSRYPELSDALAGYEATGEAFDPLAEFVLARGGRIHLSCDTERFVSAETGEWADRRVCDCDVTFEIPPGAMVYAQYESSGEGETPAAAILHALDRAMMGVIPPEVWNMRIDPLALSRDDR